MLAQGMKMKPTMERQQLTVDKVLIRSLDVGVGGDREMAQRLRA